ncbi:MAG: right-handed parallel beta-helix repeat-containing protein [Planctomycetota bacterium]|jgi:parallel beta-helix repeat protein
MLKDKTLIATIVMLVLSISAPAWAVHYYVDPNGSDDANGLSWATAFATIQKGIDATNATIVEVNEGTYYGGVDFKGVSCTVTSTDPNDYLVVAATVIDANGDTNAVSFHNSEGAGSVLTGFAVTRGTYGVHCYGAGPTITKNQIAANTDDGVALLNSSGPLVNNNWIYENGGDGIYADNCPDANLCSNTIVGNTNYGIFKNSGIQPTITNCIIWNYNKPLYNCQATCSCISDCNAASGLGNICGDGNDPNFALPSIDDYHITCDSPCIDQGAGGCGQTDIDGHPRKIGQVSDMGADEFGRVHNLDKDLWYANIQTAINDANDGNTVVVYPCTYDGTVDFAGKAITLRSTDPNNWNVVDATVIKAGDTNGVTFHESEDPNSVLSGFTITKTTTRGIHCLDSSPKIHRCVVQPGLAYHWLDRTGILCDNASPLITDCKIKDHQHNGVRCINGSAPNIVDCTITDNGEGTVEAGISCDDSDANIVHCLLKENYLGIYCEGSSALSITGCEVRDSNCHGIYCYYVSLPIFIGTSRVLYNGHGYDSYDGICISYGTSETLIRDSNIAGNGNYGIGAYYDDGNIIGCTISDNDDDGVRCSVENGTIQECVIKNNGGDGIFIAPLASGTSAVLYNQIENNDGDGIYATGSKYVTSTIACNKIGASSDHGISLDGSYADVYSNWVYGSGRYGIYAYNSSSADLWNNTIAGNLQAGIYDLSVGQPDITNCIIWDCNDDMNGCTATYSCISDCNDATGTGNICGDGNDPCLTHFFDSVDKTTAAGTTTTIKVDEANNVYEVNDVIEYDNDGTPRTVTDVNTDANIVTFDTALGANSAAGKLVYNWGPDVNDVNEDLHLTDDSPCIEAGDPCGNYSGQKDIDDEPRVADGDCDSNDIVDMGADEVYWPDCWGCHQPGRPFHPKAGDGN